MLGGWCVLVCLVLGGPRGSWGCEADTNRECQCKTRCIDLDQLDNLLDMNTTRTVDPDSRILLPRCSFNCIRENPKLHACVLTEVLEFYQSLMKTTSENNELLNFLNTMKKNCVHKNAVFCSGLKEDSRRAISNHSIKGSRNMALLQISKLDDASQKLDNRTLQEEAMAELKMLKYYIRGKGFRLYQLKKKNKPSSPC